MHSVKYLCSLMSNTKILIYFVFCFGIRVSFIASFSRYCEYILWDNTSCHLHKMLTLHSKTPRHCYELKTLAHDVSCNVVDG